MICVPGRASMPSIRPRREFRSPITSPMYSSGTTTSTLITGSSRTGFAFRAASLIASEPASLESFPHAHFRGLDVLLGNLAARDVVLEYEARTERQGLNPDLHHT